MAKVSEQARKAYTDRVRDYKQSIDQIMQREKMLFSAIDKDEDPASVAFKRINIAEERLDLASLFLLLNKVSVTLLGVKNEAFLNDARKCCYDCIIQVEKVVSDYLDVPYSDYSDMVELLNGYTDDRRLSLLRKLGFTIDSVKEEFGDNNKWKWSFVDLEGRFATISKNLINLKEFSAGMDPRVEGYISRVNWMRLTKDLIAKASDRFREKYELSTNRIDDFKMAINFLSALRRLHQVLGETDQADTVKRKYEVWKAKMEDDEKKQKGEKTPA